MRKRHQELATVKPQDATQQHVDFDDWNRATLPMNRSLDWWRNREQSES